jgi:hypothetical protein
MISGLSNKQFFAATLIGLIVSFVLIFYSSNIFNINMENIFWIIIILLIYPVYLVGKSFGKGMSKK